jgi:hypothetical protein
MPAAYIKPCAKAERIVRMCKVVWTRTFVASKAHSITLEPSSAMAPEQIEALSLPNPRSVKALLVEPKRKDNREDDTTCKLLHQAPISGEPSK